MLIMIMMMIIITVMFFFSILVDDKYSKNEFIFKWENIGHHFFRGMGDNPEENGSPKAKRKKELTRNGILLKLIRQMKRMSARLLRS